ncbi:MAG: pilus assembly protein N-terminal domain-containing protein [Burkholderiaceae bacterium]|nr:pilus assembly protein N-terminal domain-containing protein [Sulfuritalea sp.]MCF8173932.1 pilus assembly protein N-terminal domain-containing protein [Burkholderiaceae bacterium]
MLHKYLTLFCAACVLASSGGSIAATEAAKELVMFVGEIQTIPATKIHRIAIGNGALVSTKFIDDQQMLLIAEGVGDTSLVLWAPQGDVQRYIIRVGSKDSIFAYRAATEVLSDITGIQIRPMGPQIAITGSASPPQIARINALAARFPQIMPLMKALDVEMKKMIYMKVQILEAKKSFSEAIGMSWPGSIQGPVAGFAGNLQGSTNPVGAAAIGSTIPLAVTGMRTYLGIATAIQTTINLAKSNGDLTILAEPELSARSGGTAEFLAGGQIPILTAGALGTTSISYKDYGIKITIKPAADDMGNVIASLRAELSQLDQSNAVAGTPGFLTRTSETEINVKSGQTMVISGLINRDMQSDVSKVPGLGDLPIIGRLFRSDSFRGGRSDLLIAVTPVVVDPNSSMNQERIEKGLEMKERFERNLNKKDLID